MYEDFAYEYALTGGDYDVVFITFYPDRATDLWVDSLVVEQLERPTDRDLFDGRDLEAASLPVRRGGSMTAHVVRGLWHDFFGMDDALRRAGMAWTESWETLEGVSFADEPRNLYFHDVEVKPGADVLLKTPGAPILSRWRVGRGTVYAMTGTPLGEGDGVPWWEWDGWSTLLDRILAEAGQ